MRRLMLERPPGVARLMLARTPHEMRLPGGPVSAIQLHVASCARPASLEAALTLEGEAVARVTCPVAAHGWVELPLAAERADGLSLWAEPRSLVAVSVAAGIGVPDLAIRVLGEGGPGADAGDVDEPAWQAARVLGRGGLWRAGPGPARPLIILAAGEAGWIVLPRARLTRPSRPRLALLRWLWPIATLHWGQPGPRGEPVVGPGEGCLTLTLRAGAPAEILWDGIEAAPPAAQRATEQP